MIKYKLVVNVFISINKTPYSFLVFLQNWLENLLLIASNELLELDPITVMKMTVSSSFVIILTFQWYLCKSDIAIFAWKLTQNYANIPLKILNDSPPPTGLIIEISSDWIILIPLKNRLVNFWGIYQMSSSDFLLILFIWGKLHFTYLLFFMFW